MSKPLRGTLLLLVAVLLGLASASGFVAMVLALTVSHTLSAIESAFGSLIIALLFLVLARKTWLAGKAALQLSEKEGETSSAE